MLDHYLPPVPQARELQQPQGPQGRRVQRLQGNVHLSSLVRHARDELWPVRLDVPRRAPTAAEAQLTQECINEVCVVCMESPAVDFKAGIFTGNEHDGYTQFDPEKEKLRAEINELTLHNQKIAIDHDIILKKYRNLGESYNRSFKLVKNCVIRLVAEIQNCVISKFDNLE